MYWLKQVSQLSDLGIRTKPKGEYNSNTSKTAVDDRQGAKTQAPAEGSSSSSGPPNFDRDINMQGCVFHIHFHRTCNAYFEQQSIMDGVVADIVDNSDSNTLSPWWQSPRL